MKLYKPVLIESVEQADALPKGTFVQLSIMSDSWSRLSAPDDRDVYDEDEVPFYALVPIEAELEQEQIVTATGERLKTHYIARWQED